MPESFEDKYEKPLELATIFSNRLNDLKAEVKVQLPCKVHSIDYQNNQVAIEILDYDFDNLGNAVPYPIIPNVPIREPMDSGNAYIRLPIKIGDVGTIEFFDSSVADLLATGNFEYDYSEEWHSLNNGLFTNGFLPKNKLFSFDYNSKIVIGTKDGGFTLKVNNNNELEIVAPTINITSDVNVNGNITATGEITAGTIALTQHTHPYTWTDGAGSGNTSAPNT